MDNEFHCFSSLFCLFNVLSFILYSSIDCIFKTVLLETGRQLCKSGILHTCIGVHTVQTLWGHSYVCTPTLWGLYALWGHSHSPHKLFAINECKTPLNHQICDLLDVPTKKVSANFVSIVGTCESPVYHATQALWGHYTHTLPKMAECVN